MGRFAWILSAVFMVFLAGCTRPSNKGRGLVRIDTRSLSSSGALSAPPQGFKVCYGVNVTAADIPSTPRSCGMPLGKFAGFVESGGVLSVDVPRGVNRVVTVYAYLTPDSQVSCPTFSPDCQGALACSTYKVAATANVDTTEPEVEVTVTADFPALTDNMVKIEAPTSALCTGGAMVAGLTAGSGEIVDANMSPLAPQLSSPAVSMFYKRANATTFTTVTRSGMNSDDPSVTVLPQIRSIAAKPGTSLIYGTLDDGSLVAVTSTGDYTPIAVGACPFTSCQLPVWFRSFALGPGPEVFGLDWGGGVWRVIDSANTLEQVTTVPAHLGQVSVF